jgi:MOSC domain-containing protein YiiM
VSASEESSTTGRVYRLGAKGPAAGERGLPKPELAEARVLRTGVEGDYNVYRETKRSGDPGMALLLLPKEVIDQLRAEGWPVSAGDLGENVTTEGIPYEALRPPRRLRLGGVVVETTKPCDPCDNLYLLPYVGPERGPGFVKTTLGRRGWFARVLAEGRVRRGDRVDLLPRDS